VGETTQELTAQEEPKIWDTNRSQGIGTNGDLGVIRHKVN
jgi:hypothetical protein